MIRFFFLLLFLLSRTFRFGRSHNPLDYKSCDFTSSDGRSCQVCDRGHYCPISTHGEVSQHPCMPGYYCKKGIQIKCPPGRYSRGHAHSHAHSHGHGHGRDDHDHETLDSTNDTDTDTDAVTHRSSDNGERCDGLCLPGYYCPESSINTSPTQHPCGNRSVYCPLGSSWPLNVSIGYYSYNASWVEAHHDNHNDGHDDDGKYEHEHDYDSNATMSWQKICDRGHYCEGGVRYTCPPGTFNDKMGMSSIDHCRPCRRGYYCPSGSTNAKEIPCHGSDGNGNGDGDGDHNGNGLNGSDAYYCPDGCGSPIPVDIGYYSLGGEKFGRGREQGTSSVVLYESSFRMRQERCPKGYYCHSGKKIPCPSGTYGNETGLSSTSLSKSYTCSGFCPSGYYCPEATVQPIPCPRNFFSVQGWSQCIECDSVLEEGRTRCQTGRNCCNQ